MMHKLRLEVSGPSGFKGNDVSVKYVGVVTVCGIQFGVDMYVLPARGEGYPIILGRPWLIAMNARQDWESRTLLLKPPRKEGKSIQTIVYNVMEGRKESSESETLEDEWSTEDSSSTVEVTSGVSDSESEKASLLEAMGVVLTRPTTQDGGSIKETLSDEKIEDMLSTYFSKEERKEFEVMLQKHLPLFILDYKQIKGVTMVLPALDRLHSIFVHYATFGLELAIAASRKSSISARKLEAMGPLLCIIFIFLKFSLSFSSPGQLRFNQTTGHFKILQVADMHYANGATTKCQDVLPADFATCSDLNTTAFINRLIHAEQPDLIVFTGKNEFQLLSLPGDNIFGFDCHDSAASQFAAFAPAVNAHIPWAAVLGNHDHEGNLNRMELMQHIISMNYSLAQINPSMTSPFLPSKGHHYNECGLLPPIDGYGNYNLEVGGPQGSPLANKSVLNLYFLDSGAYSTVPGIGVYGWIKASQQAWFSQTSAQLQAEYKSGSSPQNASAPGLLYFHIPLPEFAMPASNMTGVMQEKGIGSAAVNSGFFTTIVEASDVKAVFVGHDHLNDFCGERNGVNLCYGGGFGYHAYGLAGWSRRARVVMASVGKDDSGGWAGVEEIRTWKRLDDDALTILDEQVLWNPSVIHS
ncbi:hypothetical protein L7F22_002328 [Adiantum nelumboides]|nr:hypothetical protein [Adiantum nelumboides]